jgi:hypothetical protein
MRRSRGRACRSPATPVAWFAFAAVSLALGALRAGPNAAAASDVRAVFGGATSSGEPFVFTLTSDPTSDPDAFVPHVGTITTTTAARCNHDYGSVTIRVTQRLVSPKFRGIGTDLWARPVSASGEFKATGLPEFGFGKLQSVVDETVHGRITGRSISGTMKATISLEEPENLATVATCRSGTLRWHGASRSGYIFGGKTSQDSPVVLTLTTARTRVRRVEISTWAQCGDRTQEDTVQEFLQIPLKSRGRFADRDRYTERFGDTLAHGVDWVTGRVTSDQIAGKVRDVYTERSRRGKVLRRCDTGTIRWHARTSPSSAAGQPSRLESIHDSAGETPMGDAASG